MPFRLPDHYSRDVGKWWSLAFCTVTSLALAVAAGLVWSQFPYSSQEALANYAKASDWLSVGLFADWSPSFLGGASLATQWGTLVSSLWIVFWVEAAGLALGPKLALLLCVPLASMTAWMFTARLTRDYRTAAFAGLFYAALPTFWLRILLVEHVVVVTAMVIIPLTAWSILRLVERPTTLSGIVAAAACGLLATTYSKAAILCAPIFGLFLLWGCWKRAGLAALLRPTVFLPSVAVLIIVAVLPNLPALRESHLAVMFNLAPLDAWKETFSTKAALQVIDRLGEPLSGFLPGFAASTALGSYYPGVLALLSLGTILIAHRDLLTKQQRALLRLMCCLALLGLWLSYGPSGLLGGALRATAASTSTFDFYPALIWLSVFLQATLIWWLLPRAMPLRKWVSGTLIFLYLVVPGFRLLSALPVYSSIRAPFDFFQVAGGLWLAVIAAMGLRSLLDLFNPRLRRWAIPFALALLGIDLAGHWSLARDKALGPRVYQDFTEIAEKLRDDPKPGAVLTISGRYFYMLLPKLTGRPLVQEAFQMYYQPLGYAALLSAANTSLPNYLQWLRLSGVRFILLDLHDPDLPQAFAQRLNESLPISAENRHFRLLRVEGAYVGGWGANGVVNLLDPRNIYSLSHAIELTEQGLAAMVPGLTEPSTPTIRNGRISDWTGSPPPLVPVNSHLLMPDGAIQVSSETLATALPFAWHPDWKTSDRRPTQAALGGLLGFVEPAESLELSFTSPIWYKACHILFLIGAVSCLAVIATALLSSRLRSRLDQPYLKANLEIARPAIQRPLAIMPTYNEADSIQQMLAELASITPELHVLVVDDASPDGTAEFVKANPDFGTRIFLHERKGKLGLGSAYRDGFSWAASQGYDACIEIDADHSHDPAAIPLLLARLNAGYDAAIGSRYLEGLRVVNWPEYRLLISSFGTQFVRVITGLPLTDATSGFKALRVAALQAVPAHSLQADGYGFQVELHHALWQAGARLTEVPITFTERSTGETKMSASIALEAFQRVFLLAFSSWRGVTASNR